MATTPSFAHSLQLGILSVLHSKMYRRTNNFRPFRFAFAIDHENLKINKPLLNLLNQYISDLAGYSSIRPVPEYSKIMPLLRLNKAMVTIGFTIKRHLWNNRGATVYQFYRQFLAELLQD